MAMSARHDHELRRHRYAWLLVLALLLPLAQAAAACHLIGHAGAASSREDTAVSQEQCATCLTAATIVGGAIAGDEPPGVMPPPVPAEPAADALPSCFLRPLRPYLGRAPPCASN
ncbi:MAG: hypothetical protein RJA36_1331 [Pseudomonadota bacterium]|jgi:hypothetical protein